jgi:hypothetical protein
VLPVDWIWCASLVPAGQAISSSLCKLQYSNIVTFPKIIALFPGRPNTGRSPACIHDDVSRCYWSDVDPAHDFSRLCAIEQYSNPRNAVFVTLLRTFGLEVAIVGVLLAYWLQKSPNSQVSDATLNLG